MFTYKIRWKNWHEMDEVIQWQYVEGIDECFALALEKVYSILGKKERYKALGVLDKGKKKHMRWETDSCEIRVYSLI